MNNLSDPYHGIVSGAGATLKPWLALLASMLFGLPLMASADFATGMNAFERQDYTVAYREFNALAEAGDPDAQYMLGRLYERGNGVLQDYSQAHKWYNLAAARGHRQAPSARDNLAQRMTPEQIAEAQSLARAWQPDSGSVRPGPGPRPPVGPGPVTQRTIADIQRLLNELGYAAGPVDGRMGGRTRTAIRQFESDSNIRITGEPSQALLVRLQEVSSPPLVTQPPAPAPEVSRQVIARTQDLLNQLGYEAGSPDGRVGNKTRNAIRSYQRANGLAATGEPSHELLNHLIRTSNTAPPVAGGPEPDEDDRRDPWRRELLGDDFRDGNYTSNPRWQVASGRFWVDNNGLNSVFEAPQSQSQQTGESRSEDLPLVILEAILKGATGVASQPPYSEIYLDGNISNAFAIDLDLSVQRGSRSIEFGPYQGSDRAVGYRLIYTPGRSGGLDLVQRTRSGVNVIQSAGNRVDLADGRSHELRWTRNRRGRMVVSVDGRQVMLVNDDGFNNDFNGFSMVNWGGGYTLHEIVVRGVN